MSKSKKSTVDVQGTTVSIVRTGNDDYISLTDMLKTKDGEFFISDWLRNRNTVEFLGIWESVFNPAFNYGEFAIIKSRAIRDYLIPPEITPAQAANTYANEADILNVSLFGLTAKEWRDANPKLDGNRRDHATVEQLLVLANIEGMNAEFIRMNLAQGDRLKRLNQIAIRQMQTLTASSLRSLPPSPGKEEA